MSLVILSHLKHWPFAFRKAMTIVIELPIRKQRWDTSYWHLHFLLLVGPRVWTESISSIFRLLSAEAAPPLVPVCASRAVRAFMFACLVLFRGRNITSIGTSLLRLRRPISCSPCRETLSQNVSPLSLPPTMTEPSSFKKSEPRENLAIHFKMLRSTHRPKNWNHR